MTTKIKLANNVADVDLTTTAPTNGQGLIYNSTSSKWVPGAAAGGGVTVYATINDLPLSGVSTGDLALVDSTNKLYLWMDTGWYNIATINTNPSITGGNETPYILATDGTPTVITLIASDPEGIPLTWSYEVTSGSLTNGGGTTATVSNDGSGQFTVTPTTTGAYAGAFSLTFKASDGVNLGTTVAEFTLAFRLVNSKYTSLLVKALASGANSTFVDSSTNGFTITKNGDVTQGTFSPFSQPEGAWSNYFDGTGDYLSIAYNEAFSFPAGTDFTFEAWVNPKAGANQTIFSAYPGAGEGNWIWRVNSSNYLALYIYPSSTFNFWQPTGAVVTPGAWNHVALTRSGTTWRMFVNGVLAGSVVATQAMGTGSNPLLIGQYNGSNYFTGHISNARVVKGTALYTGAFTPDTADPLTAITGTSLLTCQSNRFVDNSNGFAITVNGNTAVSPFGPFDRGQYIAATHGGGAYFDGTGDYLSIPDSESFNMGSGDFTIEFFYYVDSTPGNYPSAVATQSWTGGGMALRWNNTTTPNKVAFFWNGVGDPYMTSSSSYSAKQWLHIALTRSSSALTLWVNGVAEATATNSGTVDWAHGGSFAVGTSLWDGTNGFINGKVSNVRVVKGTAVYTSAFTPPTAPLTTTSQNVTASEVSLLLNCTNADIIDNDSKNNLKLVGNTAASATQTKYAARSVYFDGTGDYVYAPTDPIFDFGTGAFTIECWIYCTANTNTYSTVFSNYTAWGTNLVALFSSYNNNNKLTCYIGSGSAITAAATIPYNQWLHVAIVRQSGGTTTMYVNGTADGTPVINTADVGGVNAFWVGTAGDAPTTTGFTGYIEDLRITKGLARYTANFTPPTSELLG